MRTARRICASCHGDPAVDDEMHDDATVPFSGGRPFELGPLGTIVAPNITSDQVFGIGALADEDLVRALRYGISHEGRPLAPIMPFADLADDDLRAVISFLRTLPAVPRPAPAHEITWLGSLGLRLVISAQGPSGNPPPRMAPARDAQYGRYLAHTVANCHGCHTRRSMLTGKFTGPLFGGGLTLKEKTGTFVTPNLTSAPSGVLNDMSESDFIERFRMRSRQTSGSPMPWVAYGRMTDEDLGAIYRYLSTLPPA